VLASGSVVPYTAKSGMETYLVLHTSLVRHGGVPAGDLMDNNHTCDIGGILVSPSAANRPRKSDNGIGEVSRNHCKKGGSCALKKFSVNKIRDDSMSFAYMDK